MLFQFIDVLRDLHPGFTQINSDIVGELALILAQGVLQGLHLRTKPGD